MTWFIRIFLTILLLIYLLFFLVDRFSHHHPVMIIPLHLYVILGVPLVYFIVFYEVDDPFYRIFWRFGMKKGVYYWLAQENYSELKRAIKANPEVLVKLLRRIEKKQDFYKGVHLAETLKNEQMKVDFWNKLFQKALKNNEHSSAIDFALKMGNYPAAFELQKQQYQLEGTPPSSFVRLGELAERAGEWEDALAYYSQENAYYEIARLLIDKKEFDLLYAQCIYLGVSKMGPMVLKTLREKGLEGEFEELKTKLHLFSEQSKSLSANERTN